MDGWSFASRVRPIWGIGHGREVERRGFGQGWGNVVDIPGTNDPDSNRVAGMSDIQDGVGEGSMGGVGECGRGDCRA